jgi:phage protein D
MSTWELRFDGIPADAALYDSVSLVEVEENVDMPSAMQLTMPVDVDERGELTFVSDRRLQPFANVALMVAGGDDAGHCIFDGYVLSQKLRLENGATGSSLQVWSQDATWLMNLEEKVREWVDVTDADVAASIFGDYGINAAPGNRSDDSPSHTEQKHTLMQRGSDIQFLRMLARRNGKLCRVACLDRPGDRTGYFATPRVDGRPDVTIVANDLEAPTVRSLEFEWDVTRPTAVKARQALLDDDAQDGVGAAPDDSGIAPLDARGLADFAKKPMTVLLTATVGDAGELALRARSVLREAGWFVRCEGEADLARIKTVLRAGAIVQIDAAGSLHSGRYFVWSVRHSITSDAHLMKFVLVRNAVGPSGDGS